MTKSLGIISVLQHSGDTTLPWKITEIDRRSWSISSSRIGCVGSSIPVWWMATLLAADLNRDGSDEIIAGGMRNSE
ncbi:MAG TPA: hypothetical protein VGQ81_08335 [Acidobacteriota bacterium]|jgi:hypothetical protein|nr:hypothetical protein [Acidobacteriota bacterium]